MALVLRSLWEGAEDTALALAQSAMQRAALLALGEDTGGAEEHEADQEAWRGQETEAEKEA